MTQEEEDKIRNIYYCNSCGALTELDCCCEIYCDEEDENESLFEVAASCICGAYRIKNNKVYHVADCVCGAE